MRKTEIIFSLYDSLGLAGLMLCCVKNGLVTLVVIVSFISFSFIHSFIHGHNDLEATTATFHVLFIVSLFCAWNITTVEINSGVYLLKS